MNKNLTSINIVLDRSGSMLPVAAETINGFNVFLKEQKAAPGSATLTLAQFDDQYELVHDAVPLDQVPDLTSATYVPRGYTALLDAIGRTIVATGAQLAKMPEAQRPAKVLFLVMTDGEENQSREYTRQGVHELITHQREKYGWEFVFIGANVDVITTAKSLGIDVSNAVGYSSDKAGTANVIRSMSAGTSRYRGQSSSRMKGVIDKT